MKLDVYSLPMDKKNKTNYTVSMFMHVIIIEFMQGA